MSEPGTQEAGVIPETEIEVWIKELVNTGLQRLQSPQGMEGRKFVLILRRADGNTTRKFSKMSLAFESSDWKNVNEVLVLDVLEEVKEDGEIKYKPVGWKDYRIVMCEDGTVANGNRGSRLYTTYESPWPYPDSSKAEELSKVPFRDFVSGYIDGFRVNNEYQRYGFGKLLAAAALESLKQIKVDELDFHGRLSSKASPIMQSLGYRPEVVKVKTYRQPISEFSSEKTYKYINPFIPRG